MYKFDEKLFEKYFFYGLENRETLLEGIIFYTNRDLNLKYLNIRNEEEQPPIKEKLRNLLKRTSKNWEQIYKFTDAVEQPERYDAEIREEESQQIKELVFDKIRQLDEQKIFNKCKRGIFCDKKFEYKYAYIDPETKQGPGDKWTQEVYDVILQLNYLEENEPIEYYDKFLQAKLSRAQERAKMTGEKESAAEVEQIKEVYKKFQERKSIAKQAQSIGDEA